MLLKEYQKRMMGLWISLWRTIEMRLSICSSVLEEFASRCAFGRERGMVASDSDKRRPTVRPNLIKFFHRGS